MWDGNAPFNAGPSICVRRIYRWKVYSFCKVFKHKYIKWHHGYGTARNVLMMMTFCVLLMWHYRRPGLSLCLDISVNNVTGYELPTGVRFLAGAGTLFATTFRKSGAFPVTSVVPGVKAAWAWSRPLTCIQCMGFHGMKTLPLPSFLVLQSYTCSSLAMTGPCALFKSVIILQIIRAS